MLKILLPPALWLLIRMQIRGRMRKLVRGMRTTKGIAYTAFMGFLIVIWIGPAIMFGLTGKPGDPALIRSMASTGMLAICCLSLLGVSPEGGIAFSMAEVDYLFPGPFRRRQLLAYRIVIIALATMGITGFLSLFVMRYATFFAAAYIGAFLGFFFIQVFQITAALIASTVMEKAFTLLRKIVLIAVVAAIAVGLSLAASSATGEGPLEVVTQFRQSLVGKCLLAPFDVFGRTFAAQTLPELAQWAGLGMLIDLAMVVFILRLDANYVEASVQTSQRMYERLKRARRGRAFIARKPLWKLRTLPRLPWMRGAGPIVWRQLLTAIRGAGGLFLAVVVMAVPAGVLLFLNSMADNAASVGTIFGLAIMASVMLPQFVHYDFRSDADQMDSLKALPVTPVAMAAGQLATPVLVAIVLEASLIAVMGLLQGGLPREAYIAAAFLPPVNVLVFGLENVLFLLYPNRVATPGGADLLAMARQMLTSLLKIIVLLSVAGVSAGVGGIAYLAFRGSIAALIVASWLTACVLAVLIVPVIGFAYRRFDPSMDTPD